MCSFSSVSLSSSHSTRDSYFHTCSPQHVRTLCLDVARTILLNFNHSTPRCLPYIWHAESGPLSRYNQRAFLTPLQENLKIWFGWLLRTKRRTTPIGLAPIAFKPAESTCVEQSATQSHSINSIEPITDKPIYFAPIVLVHGEEV